MAENGQNHNNKRVRFNIYWMYAVVFLALMGAYWFSGNSQQSKPMSLTEFEAVVERGGVTRLLVYNNSNEAEAVLSDSLARVVFGKAYQPHQGSKPMISTHIPSGGKFDDTIARWRQEGVFTGEVQYGERDDYSTLLWTFGPVVLFIALWVLVLKRMGGGSMGGGGGIFNVGKSKAALFDKNTSSKVNFDDVAGLAEAKVEIAEIVDFLKHPQHYTELGGKIPKGALLVGPPGTGKTLLAKAVAGEANVPFFSMSGSDFVEMFVGVGASRVRDLFRQAKEKAPCIVFIDEIDAVGRARGRNVGMSSNDERENTLNQLLTEMDGFGSNSGVIILAATNRADILDKALLRAGRFDRQIYVELPELSDRKEIFQVHLRKVRIDGSVDLDLLARQTPGFSGADIANVCNEAALIAARKQKQAVQRQDFMDAIDRIVGGLEKKSRVITDEERHSIAVHEAGHATVSWHLRYADPLIKVTIVPRGKSLGAAWYMPEERNITPRQALLDQICSLMGGRVAEELFLGFTDTGAISDLERATKIAYAMVTYYGMGHSIPNISYYDSSGQQYGFTKPYSENRAQAIDNEVQQIINEQYERAKQMLTKYAAGHHELADLLERNEVIFTEDAERIFGKRPWVSRTEEILRAAEDRQSAQDDSAEQSADATAADATTAEPPVGDTAASGSDTPSDATPPPFRPR